MRNGSRSKERRRTRNRAVGGIVGGGSFDPFNPDITYGTLNDTRDNKEYKTIVMPDGKEWMAENLNHAAADGTGSWCYDNSPDSCAKYGRLYNWNTAMNDSSSSGTNPSGVQGVCPAGWHLPSYDEWDMLRNSLGSSYGTKLRSQVGWYGDGNGTNEFGFSVIPGGIYLFDTDKFDEVGYVSYWWAATESDDARARSWIMSDNGVFLTWRHQAKSDDLSVRCVKN